IARPLDRSRIAWQHGVPAGRATIFVVYLTRSTHAITTASERPRNTAPRPRVYQPRGRASDERVGRSLALCPHQDSGIVIGTNVEAVPDRQGAHELSSAERSIPSKATR